MLNCLVGALGRSASSYITRSRSLLPSPPVYVFNVNPNDISQRTVCAFDPDAFNEFLHFCNLTHHFPQLTHHMQKGFPLSFTEPEVDVGILPPSRARIKIPHINDDFTYEPLDSSSDPFPDSYVRTPRNSEAAPEFSLASTFKPTSTSEDHLTFIMAHVEEPLEAGNMFGRYTSVEEYRKAVGGGYVAATPAHVVHSCGEDGVTLKRRVVRDCSTTDGSGRSVNGLQNKKHIVTSGSGAQDMAEYVSFAFVYLCLVHLQARARRAYMRARTSSSPASVPSASALIIPPRSATSLARHSCDRVSSRVRSGLHPPYSVQRTLQKVLLQHLYTSLSRGTASGISPPSPLLLTRAPRALVKKKGSAPFRWHARHLPAGMRGISRPPRSRCHCRLALACPLPSRLYILLIN